MIAFIPARGGSKGISNKNIIKIAGRPLIEWAVNACVQCEEIDRVYVATDSQDIRDVVKGLNYDSVLVTTRSKASATDEAATEVVVEEFFEADIACNSLVLVQATNPFITAGDLSAAIQLFRTNLYGSIVSVVNRHFFTFIQYGIRINKIDTRP